MGLKFLQVIILIQKWCCTMISRKIIWFHEFFRLDGNSWYAITRLQNIFMSVRIHLVIFYTLPFSQNFFYSQEISKMVFVFTEKLAFLLMVLKNCGFLWLTLWTLKCFYLTLKNKMKKRRKIVLPLKRQELWILQFLMPLF